MQSNLKKTVQYLAGEIGPRGYLQTEALGKAAEYIRGEFSRFGYDVSEQAYEVEGRDYRNIIAEIKGSLRPEKVLVVGAHYDTVAGTPGADDNASGVAGLLELSRLLKGSSPSLTIQFLAFTLEEPPFFRSSFMGSQMYAQSLKQKGVEVEGMICLEMIGYFTDDPKSQLFPLPFLRWKYPTKGNFITLVSNIHSKQFLKRVINAFRRGTDLRAEAFSAPSFVIGTDFSDHRSFWKQGYEAVMVTDTAFFRNPQYHGTGDVPDILDYERMADVVLGLKTAVEELAYGT